MAKSGEVAVLRSVIEDAVRLLRRKRPEQARELLEAVADRLEADAKRAA